MNLYIYKSPDDLEHFIDEDPDRELFTAEYQRTHYEIQERVITDRIEKIMADRDKLRGYIKDYAAKVTMIDLAVDVTIGDDCGSAREIKMQATENIREDVIGEIVSEYIETVNAMMEDAA